MSAKTTFWYGLVVALAVVGSTAALPLSTNDDSAMENGKTVVLPAQPKEGVVVTESAQPTGRTEDLAAVSTDPSSAPQTESTDDGSAADVATSTPGVQQTENAAVGSTSPAEPDRSEPTTATATAIAAQPESQQPAAAVPSSGPGAHVHGLRPKPYYADGAQTVKVGPSIPFYLEFFQPFQPLPVQSYPNRQNPLPPRHQQPYGAVIDPFDPFGNSPVHPFNQIIEAYTNEFRTPEVIIVKPKRNVQLNTTAMPPIPLLMNIMLNAFRHNQPTEMLESFDQNMQRIPQQGEVFDNTQSGSNKPVSKTTTKTEVINGHVVQINETTYSDGDENHKSFYHFKEIQVLPGANNKKIASEKVSSLTKDDSEKIEMNEIKRDPIELFDDEVPQPVILPNLVKKNVPAASGPLGEYFQTAAGSHYGSSYAPAYYVHKPTPPSPPTVTWYDIINGHHQQSHHQPGYQPGHHHPGYQPGQQSGYQPGQHPGYQPGQQSGYLPGQQFGYQPGQQPGYQPGQLPGYQPGQQPGYQPGQQPGYQPGQQPGYQPGQQSGYQPGNRPGYQPGRHQPGYQAGHEHAVSGPHFGGVGAPVVSLSGDTLVNDLMAERLKASGAQYQLPADVVLVDVNELQSRPAPGARGIRRRSTQQQSADDGRRYVLL